MKSCLQNLEWKWFSHLGKLLIKQTEECITNLKKSKKSRTSICVKAKKDRRTNVGEWQKGIPGLTQTPVRCSDQTAQVIHSNTATTGYSRAVIRHILSKLPQLTHSLLSLPLTCFIHLCNFPSLQAFGFGALVPKPDFCTTALLEQLS